MAIDNRKKTYLESLVDELLAKLGRLDSILTHAPSKGNYHEEILRDIIEEYLPPSFSVGSGFVMNERGDLSSQTDVLVIDNLDPRSYVYKNNNFFIVADISVACFGEVKTYCKKSEFFDTFQNLLNAKSLVCEPSARTRSFIFCYDAYANPKNFAKWTDEAIKNLKNRNSYKTWHYPDYIFCFKKNIMLERKNLQNGFQYIHAISEDKTIKQLMISELLQCVTTACGNMRKLQGINLIDKVGLDLSQI